MRNGLKKVKDKIKIFGIVFGIGIGILNILGKLSKKKALKDDDLKKDCYEGAGTKILNSKRTFYDVYIKRLIDIILSSIGIIVLSPLFLILAVIIYLDDPGPIFFSQKRVGVYKTFFKLYKFRSMKMSTPSDMPTHMLADPEQYITRVGKILRKYSLDELPQFYNILVGDISIVGPRPALWNQEDLVAERDKYGANDVMPGLTGWAQINGRDELEIPVKAKFDGEYVEKLRKNSVSGIMMDARCFFGTILSVLKSDGVVEGGTGELNKQEGKRNYPDVETQIGFGEPVEIDYSVKKKVLITGANSYIGESFEKYAMEHYADNYEIDTIDMIDGSWREKDFSAYDIVFHVAGIAHADVGNVSEEVKEKYYVVNTDLAVETAEKAKADGVNQFVFMSSMIIYGDSAPYGKEKMITANTKPTPANFYGDSKWQADKGVRGLADDNFQVLVLRPPMIYGKGSKGNYPTLAKLAKKLPIFPDVENQRSMLYVENLCEFLCQVMLVGKGGIFFPQNEEYTKTADMVAEISKIAGKKIVITKLLNPLVWIGSKVPGKIGVVINKAFGNSCYEDFISVYKGINYRNNSLKSSILKVESKKDTEKKTSTVCIINCFDTYEHRVDLLHNYFKKIGDVKVYTSDYRHFEKKYRVDKKQDFEFIHAVSYEKNMSFSRLYSHMKFSKDVLKKICKEEYDLLWVLVPPNSLVQQMAKYKKKNKSTKLIFDLIDLWPETMPISISKSLLPFKLWENMRNKHLKMADAIVTECDLYRERIPVDVAKEKIHTVYLAREIKPYNYEVDLAEDEVVLCYLGSINNIIDIPSIADFISRLSKYKKVKLHIIGDGENRESLIESAKGAGANVIYHGKVYDNDEKQEIFSHCHYGLNIMKKSVFVGLTMKSMDYFEAGLPIINNIHGDTWDIIENKELGVNLDESLNYKNIIEYKINMRDNVRAFFETEFGVSSFENKLDKCLKDLRNNI